MLQLHFLPHKNFHRIVFFIAFCLYSYAAFNSHGYYQFDEHYQIVEFAGLKLGTHAISDLAWEYNANIRSAIQPAICFVVLKTLTIINITDAYNQMFVLRQLTAVLALIIICFFVRVSLRFFKSENKKAFILLSYFLFFLPLVNVRFSSEAWAGLMFLLALAVLLSNGQHTYFRYFMGGVLLALSFLFRYQMAFLFPGLALWLFFIRKEKFKYIALLFAGAVMVVGMGFFIDAWFYQKFVFTCWKYFYVNIIEDVASNFGTSPWWYYFVYLLRFPYSPIGIILLLSMVLLIIKQPANLILWCLLPFVAMHSIIPHKEIRFLFPVVNLVPILIILSYQEVQNFMHDKGWHLAPVAKLTLRFFLALIILLNVTGLLIVSSKSAEIGRMEITKFIHEKYTDKPVRLLYSPWCSPYNPWHSLPAKFYQEKNLEEIKVSSICGMDTYLLEKNWYNLLVTKKSELNNRECLQKLNDLGYTQVVQSIPAWIEFLNKYLHLFNNDEIVVLMEYKVTGV